MKRRNIVIRSGGYAYVPKKKRPDDAFLSDTQEVPLSRGLLREEDETLDLEETRHFQAFRDEDQNETYDYDEYFEEDAEALDETDEKKSALNEFTRFFKPKEKGYDDRLEQDNLKDPKQPLFVKRSKPKNFFLRVTLMSLLLLFIIGLGAGFAGLGVLNGFISAYVSSTPPLDVSLIADQDEATSIYDTDGKLITTFIAYENREWAKIDQIPDMLKNAFIAVEDVRFYQHDGIDFKRLFGAVLGVFTGNYDGGGSTITQQLIKIQVLGNEQSYKRKVQEADLAMQLEKQLDKDQILEAYLNAIHLGDSNYGVKAAAEDYFGKSMDELSIRECAMLAGLTQNPNGYNPRKNMYQREDMSRTDERTNTVLRRMYAAGFITKEQKEAALTEEVNILEFSKVKQIYDMPSFVEYAVYDVITHMLRKENLQDNKQNRDAMERKIRVGGYQIYTTVDPEIQNTVQKTVSKWEDYPKLRNPARAVVRETQKNGDVIETVQPQVAAVVIDYHTGQVKALVGRRDQATQLKLLNRGYNSRMEVGSSIKPLAVYAPALEKGVSPGNIYLNYPVEIEGYGGKRGYPLGGLSKTGPVTMREGVKRSLNGVAARVLFEDVGLEKAKDTLIDLGIDPSGINVDGPGLALGTTAVSPLEMAAAYGTLANEGVYLEPIAFTKVLDRNGNVVLDAEQSQNKRMVFHPSTAYLMTDMLEDAVRSGTGTKAKIENMHVAGKTGTNADYRSVYFAGYTPYYVASLWIGHDSYAEDAKLQSGATGGTFAAPLWKAFMGPIHEGLSDKAIINKEPAALGLVEREICSVSGLLATEECRKDSEHSPIVDWFLLERAPEESCDLHARLELCSVSGKLATQYCPAGNVKMQIVVIAGANSKLSDIPPDMLQKDFSNIYVNINKSRLESLSSDDSAYEKYYCDVHGARTVLDAMTIDQAQNLVDKAKNALAFEVMSQELYEEIEMAVEHLQTLIDLDSPGELLGNQYLYLEELLARIGNE